MWGNATPGTEFPRIFCAGIGPLQLGVVLVYSAFARVISRNSIIRGQR